MNTYKLLKQSKGNFFYSSDKSGKVRYESDILYFLTKRSIEYKDRIDKLRYINSYDEKAAKEYKIFNIPSMTMSATFKDRRVVGDVKEKTGIIAIDIDKDENLNLDVNKAKNDVMKLPFVMLASLSSRGEGIYCLVYYNKDNIFVNTFNALKKEFKDIGYNIDKKCRDITRLRYATWDDDIKVREEVEMFDKTIQDEVKERYECEGEWILTKQDVKDIVIAIYALVNFFNYTSNDYEEWLLDGFRLATIPNRKVGLELFNMISENSEKYKGYEDVKDKFNECCRTTTYKTNILGYYINRIKEHLGDEWRYRINDIFKEKNIRI